MERSVSSLQLTRLEPEAGRSSAGKHAVRSSLERPERPAAPVTVAIVGGGYSGTLLALQLLRTEAPVRLILIENTFELARGVAYSTDRLEHLLNVPAGNMSALAGQPQHFLEWLRRRDPQATSLTFAPRAWYGDYLAELLEASWESSRGRSGMRPSLEARRSEVLELEPVPGAGFWVTLSSGEVLEADYVVLATGHQGPSDPLPPGHDLAEDPRYVRNPWAHTAPPGKNDAVLILGTGLTAVDHLLTLEAVGHEGPVLALSRHGLLPQAHVQALLGKPTPPQLCYGAGLTEVLRTFRRQLRAEMAVDPERWRTVIDGVRPQTAAFWGQLSLQDQRRFMRHLRAFWDVGRHRIAPELGEKVQGWLKSGWLTCLSGRIKQVKGRADAIQVVYQPRHSQETREVWVQHLVNCTGPDTNLRRSRSPLLQSLFRRGLIQSDPLALGLETTAQGALLSRDGVAAERLFTLGPLLRPRLWESIAVPELREQALALANLLAARAQAQRVSALELTGSGLVGDRRQAAQPLV